VAIFVAVITFTFGELAGAAAAAFGIVSQRSNVRLRSSLSAHSSFAVADTEHLGRIGWMGHGDEFQAAPNKKALASIGLAAVCLCCIIPALLYAIASKKVASAASQAKSGADPSASTAVKDNLENSMPGEIVTQLSDKLAKHYSGQFDKECLEEEKGKYCSKEFKARCDEVFKAADVDGKGILGLKELRPHLHEYLKIGDKEVPDETLDFWCRAFNGSRGANIYEGEFLEMMKFFEWKKDLVEDSHAAAMPNKDNLTSEPVGCGEGDMSRDDCVR